MKKFAMILMACCVILPLSCRNNKGEKTSRFEGEEPELVAEAVAEEKAVIAEDVLASVDSLAKEFVKSNRESDISGSLARHLTEREKMVKPDYLLDPAKADEVLNRTQKMNIMAILLAERPVREAYLMSVDEATAAIARLAVEVNLPVNLKEAGITTPSDVLAEVYNACILNGDMISFWKFASAFQKEIFYLLASNPELYFRNMDGNQYISFLEAEKNTRKAIAELAPYDAEMAEASKILATDSEEQAYTTIEEAKKGVIWNRDVLIARRGDLLK